MKKLVLLFSCCIMIGISVCSAEIAKGIDQFTGGAKFISGTKGEDDATLGNILFKKIVTGTTEEYFIEADNEAYKERILADKSIEIKIDDNPICLLGNSNYKTYSPINWKMLAVLTVNVPDNIIIKLRDANRVALRFTRNNGSQFVYVLPDNVLAEWKQVIATEK